MPTKEIGTIYFKSLETGEEFKVGKLSEIKVSIKPDDCQEDKDNNIHSFNTGYWNKRGELVVDDLYWDLRYIFPSMRNNSRKMHGKRPLPYRELFKHNPKKYALIIYNSQRKYIRDKYTFEEWKTKKGIV